MWFKNLISSLNSTSRRRRPIRQSPPAGRRLRLESLEDRSLLSLTPVANLAVGAIVVTADFNNDGDLDLATASGNSVSVRLGDGNGGFGAATPFATGSNQSLMAVGDFNDDGNLDLAIRPGNILLGNGDGAFQPPIINPVFALPPLDPQSVAAADFDGDGNSDFAYTYMEGTSGQGWVGVRISNGEGGFATSNEYDLYKSDLYEGVGADGLAVADLNGDGKPDIVTTDPFGVTVNVLMGRGNGTFSLYLGENFDNFDTGPYPRAVAVGDFTGDGIPDLVTAGRTVDVLPGLGEGDFGISLFGPPINQSANSSGMTTVAAADFNGDGKLDVVAADPTASTVSVFLGRGDGTLTSPIDHTITGSSPRTVAVGDFNGDGKPDVAAGNVLLNDGNWPAVGPTLPGDYNGNDIVDAADYTVWRNTLGSSVTAYDGADGSGNGMVDEADYGVWKSHFGQTLLPPAAGSGVAAITLTESVSEIGRVDEPEPEASTAAPNKLKSDAARVAGFAMFEARSARYAVGSGPLERFNNTGVATSACDNFLLLATDRLWRFSKQNISAIENRESIDSHADALDSPSYINSPLAVALAEWQYGDSECSVVHSLTFELCAGSRKCQFAL